MTARWVSILCLAVLPCASTEAGDAVGPGAPPPVPTLTRVVARVAPTTDGAATDAAWVGAPEVVVDAVAGAQKVALRVQACRTAEEGWLLCRWSDPVAVGAAEGGSAAKPPVLVATWGEGPAADGSLAPTEPGKDDVTTFDAARPAEGAAPAVAGRHADGAWVVELKHRLGPRAGALRLALEGATGAATATTGMLRVRGAWSPVRRDFEAETPGEAPEGFVPGLGGRGKPPSWIVRPEASTKNLMLVQESQDDEGDRFALATLAPDRFRARDVDLSVRFRALKGFKDQGAGLIWRVKDAHNHYILRANVLEQNVVCYKMEDNLRVDLPPKGHEGEYGLALEFDKQAWHTLRVVAVQDRIEAYLDGRLLYEVVDATFLEPGGAGLWTKSDSVIAFDDFVAASYDAKGR